MSIKEKLQKRGRPTAEYPISLGEREKIQDELLQAQIKLNMEQKKPDGKPRPIQAKINKLKKDLDEEIVYLKFQAIDPREFEALMAEHPPSEKEKKEGEIFSREFHEQLVAACSLEPKFEYQEWMDEYLPTLTEGERADIISLVAKLNMRSVDDDIPKGLSQILSSS